MIKTFCLALSLTFLGALIFLSGCDKDDGVTKNAFTISGRITEKGQGVANVPVTINNNAGANTSSNGNFQLEDLKPGTYIISPDEPGRVFLPAELSVDITSANVASMDFVRVAADQVLHRDEIWDLLNPSVYAIKQNSATSLQLDLESNALWYNASQGGLIYRSVTGNFTLAARVSAVMKSNNAQPVACDICLGGLMVRNPSTSSGENYVHLVTGNTPDGIGVEFKSTTNSASVFNTDPDGSNAHDLRIQRSGSTFTLSQKLPNETSWTVAATYNRTDLPQTLMVGVNIYTAQAGAVADLSLIYENVTIE